MADLRIVDAPEIPTEDITGEEKLPTGGSGNYSISLDSLADYTKTKKDLVDNTSVEGKVGGVRQELNTHIEDLLNPHQVTKGQIGLGNVDNTADADKPVSNSTQAAIISAVAPKADKTYVDTALSSKTEKTYVDNQLTLKANKTDVYTKQQSSDLVNNSISTALTPVNTSLDLAKRGIANRYDSSLVYNSGERVVLTNSDIVKSTVDGNTSDPNVDMTGWEFDEFSKSIYNPLNLNYTQQQLATAFTGSLNSLINKIYLKGGGTISIPDGTFYISPAIGITLKDNIELRLGKNTVLRNINHALDAYEMIRAWDVNSVKISGGKIDGNREGNSATSGEWGMGISIRGSKDVTVRDMDISNCWGDGVYIGRTESADCTDGLLIENLTSSNCRRQGISVVSLKNATFNQLTFKDVNGTAPAAGIDFEPNYADEWLQNIIVNGLHTENCQGTGMQLYCAPLGWRVWSISTSYLKGNVVKHNNSYYKAKRANTGVTPAEVSSDWLHLPDFDTVSDRVSITVNGHVDRGSMRGFYSLGQESKTNVSGKFILNNASYLNKDNHNIFTQNNVADGVQVYINDPELINDNTDASIQHVRISNAPADYSLGGVHLLRPKFKSIGVDTACVYIYANNSNGLANKNISILDIIERPAGVLAPVQMVARRVENLQLRDQFNQNRLNATSSTSINDFSVFESYYINSGSSTFNINGFLAGRTIKILNEHVGVATVNLVKAGSDIATVTNSAVRSFTLQSGGNVELFAVSDTLLRVVRSSGLINLSKSSRGTIAFPATTFAANESKLIATVATLTAARYTDTVSVSSTIDLVGNIALSATINTNGTISIYGTNLKSSQVSYGAAGQYLNVVVH